MNSLKPVLAKYRLGRITCKYLIIDIIFWSSFRQRGFAFLHQASKSLRKLLRENLLAAITFSKHAIDYIKELPCTISTVLLPGTAG